MNEGPVYNNETGYVSTEDLFNAFPNVTSSEEPFVMKTTKTTDYFDFYNEVYEMRNEAPLFPYRYGSYNVFQANKEDQQYQVNTYLNVTSQDATALFPQYMYTAILRNALDEPDFQFNVTTTPFPVFYAFITREKAAKSFDYIFMLSIALALIPCVVVSFIINEREKQLKHQQLISGMSMCGYWASNVISDIFSAYVPILCILLLNYAFSLEADYGYVFLLLYPLAVIPFSYLTSFVFSDDTSAQIVTLFTHFIAAGAFPLVVFILQLVPNTVAIGDKLRYVGLIVPSFAVTHAFTTTMNLSSLVKSRNEAINGDYPDLEPWPEDLWAWENLKGDAVALVVWFAFGLVCVAIFESPLFDSCKDCACLDRAYARDEQDMDDDVLEEEERISNMKNDGEGFLVKSQVEPDIEGAKLESADKNSTPDVIRVHNFSKTYNRNCHLVRAVQGVSFGLDYGECFALLGVNGAGKSTTFKSLTRDIVPTTGEISIQGFDVQKDFTSARKLIGYCPQHDAIFPLLTVEEHLYFYARVKGIHPKRRKQAIKKAIKDLNLDDYRHKPAGTLSGGNKRKLSVAMAIIGNPPIILLDEPSAGMDPGARRFMWQVVEKISQRDKKSAVILTSHSMEEAEALSTKLGIMVRGGIFRCFGTSQHVKSKFGVGYELEVKVQKAEYSQLAQLAGELGLGQNLQAKIGLDAAKNNARKAGIPEVILEQISKVGIGAELVIQAEIDSDNEVSIMSFVAFLFAQRLGFRVIDYLTRIFSKLELLEQCGDFYKLRVPKENRTIGWLFGRIEDEKQKLGIQEYSISQTSLEQIFQMFANQTILEDKNAFVFRQDANNALICLNVNREVQDD